MENNKDHVSLYEYLGRRAGMNLGQQVFQESKKQKIRCSTREISQGGYTGKVMCYPRTFLESYFGSGGKVGVSVTNSINNYPIN